MRVRIVKQEVLGVIVFSQIESYGATEVPRGIITLQRRDGGYVKLAVKSFTDFDTLKEGEMVRAEYDEFSGSDSLAATKICRVDGNHDQTIPQDELK